MASGLLLLLDDIATILDDVAFNEQNGSQEKLPEF